ncbi:MAG: hypothetical protein U5L45_00345 [Saprospiraceae bacterium]|nr:hypothetical protein [Saprospiraceae bacterium]
MKNTVKANQMRKIHAYAKNAFKSMFNKFATYREALVAEIKSFYATLKMNAEMRSLTVFQMEEFHLSRTIR